MPTAPFLLPKGCLADHEVKLIKCQAPRPTKPLLQSNKIELHSWLQQASCWPEGVTQAKLTVTRKAHTVHNLQPLVSESQTGKKPGLGPGAESASLTQPHPFLGPRIPTPHTIPPFLSKDSPTGGRKLSPQKLYNTDIGQMSGSSQRGTEAKVHKRKFWFLFPSASKYCLPPLEPPEHSTMLLRLRATSYSCLYVPTLVYLLNYKQ